jgi:hypothetical protein
MSLDRLNRIIQGCLAGRGTRRTDFENISCLLASASRVVKDSEKVTSYAAYADRYFVPHVGRKSYIRKACQMVLFGGFIAYADRSPCEAPDRD